MRRMTMIEQINSRFKRIEDSINNYANGKDVDQIKLLEDDIKVSEANKQVRNIIPNNDIRNMVNPEDIVQDSTHRFITDVEKEEIKEKMISKTTLAAVENDIVNNLKITINQQIDNIINNKDATDAINKIIKITSENKDAIDLFKNLIDKDELKSHEQNGLHITEKDRIALNLLLKFIDKGCADWNASEGEPNYIRNKPESLKANGGNSDTVGGCRAEDLFTKQIAKNIIGIYNNPTKYSANDVNIYLNEENKDSISKYLNSNCLTYLREGYYRINEFKIPINSNISGVGIGTQIDHCGVSIDNNCKVSDIYFSNSLVNIICNESEIVDAVFKNCHIWITASRCIIKNCRFINCPIHTDSINNSIITDNICSGSTNQIIYYGGNNIIKNLYV